MTINIMNEITVLCNNCGVLRKIDILLFENIKHLQKTIITHLHVGGQSWLSTDSVSLLSVNEHYLGSGFLLPSQ